MNVVVSLQDMAIKIEILFAITAMQGDFRFYVKEVRPLNITTEGEDLKLEE